MALAGEANEDLDSIKKFLDSAQSSTAALSHATAHMLAFAKKSKENRAKMFEEAKHLCEENLQACEKISDLGTTLIPSEPREGQDTVNIIHHGSSGALAGSGVGTGLSSIIKRAKASANVFAWVCETRPKFHGSRLAAFELAQAKVPFSIISDSATGSILARNRADCVFVGAHRIAANGDVINKIGTYPLSVVAKENGIPVYCFASTSTIDLNLVSGLELKSEERTETEILELEGKRFVQDSARGFNPSVDVTPFRYITAVVTEEGVCYPPFRETLAAAKARAVARNQGLDVSSSSTGPSTIEKVTEILEKTGIKRSSGAERLFPGQSDQLEEKRPYRREDPRATKGRTYLGDGSDIPKPDVVRDPAKTSKTFLGDGSDDVSKKPPEQPVVRHFNEMKKPSLVLSDEAPAAPEAKLPSVRVLAKTKQTSINPDDTAAKPSNGRSESSEASTWNKEAKEHIEPHPPADQAASASAKTHIEPPNPSQDHAPSSKAHIDPPKREEREMPTRTRAHFPPPSPEKEAAPQSKAYISPAKTQSSNIFG
jgi:methylthioribose-1-phosphate isomerase